MLTLVLFVALGCLVPFAAAKVIACPTETSLPATFSCSQSFGIGTFASSSTRLLLAVGSDIYAFLEITDDTDPTQQAIIKANAADCTETARTTLTVVGNGYVVNMLEVPGAPALLVYLHGNYLLLLRSSA